MHALHRKGEQWNVFLQIHPLVPRLNSSGWVTTCLVKAEVKKGCRGAGEVSIPWCLSLPSLIGSSDLHPVVWDVCLAMPLALTATLTSSWCEWGWAGQTEHSFCCPGGTNQNLKEEMLWFLSDPWLISLPPYSWFHNCLELLLCLS